MSHYSTSLHAPYGAYELKATYQRNLLLGMLAVLLVTAGAIAAGRLLPSVDANGSAQAGPGATPIEIKVNQQPISIIREPAVGRPPAPRELREGGIIPVPVPDEQITDEDDRLILSMAERAEIIDWPGSGSGGVGGGYAGGSAADDHLPEIDEIVFVEREPELIYSVSPEYPRLAKLAGVEGRVIMKALVGKEGDVLEAVVFVGSGNALLDEAALAVAGKYKYRPAIQNDRPTAIWVTYKVEFKLD